MQPEAGEKAPVPPGGWNRRDIRRSNPNPGYGMSLDYRPAGNPNWAFQGRTAQDLETIGPVRTFDRTIGKTHWVKDVVWTLKGKVNTRHWSQLRVQADTYAARELRDKDVRRNGHVPGSYSIESGGYTWRPYDRCLISDRTFDDMLTDYYGPFWKPGDYFKTRPQHDLPRWITHSKAQYNERYGLKCWFKTGPGPKPPVIPFQC